MQKDILVKIYVCDNNEIFLWKKKDFDNFIE